jgi:hypothetical protein
MNIGNLLWISTTSAMRRRTQNLDETRRKLDQMWVSLKSVFGVIIACQLA